MGILIRGMEMPSACDECQLCDDGAMCLALGIDLFAVRIEKFLRPKSFAFLTARQEEGVVVSNPTERNTTSSEGFSASGEEARLPV